MTAPPILDYERKDGNVIIYFRGPGDPAMYRLILLPMFTSNGPHLRIATLRRIILMHNGTTLANLRLWNFIHRKPSELQLFKGSSREQLYEFWKAARDHFAQKTAVLESAGLKVNRDLVFIKGLLHSGAQDFISLGRGQITIK